MFYFIASAISSIITLVDSIPPVIVYQTTESKYTTLPFLATSVLFITSLSNKAFALSPFPVTAPLSTTNT